MQCSLNAPISTHAVHSWAHTHAQFYSAGLTYSLHSLNSQVVIYCVCSRKVSIKHNVCEEKHSAEFSLLSQWCVCRDLNCRFHKSLKSNYEDNSPHWISPIIISSSSDLSALHTTAVLLRTNGSWTQRLHTLNDSDIFSAAPEGRPSLQ